MERSPVDGPAGSVESSERVAETAGHTGGGVERCRGHGHAHPLGEGSRRRRDCRVGHATNCTRSWSHDQLADTLAFVAYVSAADRKEQLIEATIAVLRSAGADAVTTRAIAAEADAPLASIHYTFGSLDDLVVAAFERLIDELSARITDGLDVSAGYGRCIVDVMDRVAALLDDERYGVLLHDLNPTGNRRLQALEDRYYRLAHDLIDAVATARRREPALPRAQLARLIMAAIDGVVLQFVASGDIRTAQADLTAFGKILATAADRRR